MKKLLYCALLSLWVAVLLSEAPQFTISVLPTSLSASLWDYMPGSYLDTPVVVQDPENGGDIYMIYQHKAAATEQRRFRLARIGLSGNLELQRSFGNLNRAQGYPSICLDSPTGIPLFAWHEELSSDTDGFLDVGFMAGDMEGIPGPMWEPAIVIDNPFTINDFSQNQFVWPTVASGPSPLQNMRRIYVLARNSATYTTGSNGHNVLLAYRDVSTADLVNGNILQNWNTVSIPQMDEWFFFPNGYERQFDGTLLCREDGLLYLIGNYSEQYQEQYQDTQRKLAVFVNDSYGQGPWRLVSTNSVQIPSQVSNAPAGWDLANIRYDVKHSNHFNAVWDNDLRIHYPQLFTAFDDTGSHYPWFFAIRDVIFDTVSESFAIHDLYPRGATPHSDPCYTPWDVNEDHLVDDPQMSLPQIFPFCYFDSTAHSDAMTYYYNHVKMTEPNSNGVMACVWSDSKAAISNPELTGPDTYIAVSPDFGQTWLDPIVLNPLQHPTPNGTMTFVYPANKLVLMGPDPWENPVYRLFLMFFDDNGWGAGSLSGSSFPQDGGNLSYLALDITVPYLAGSDPLVPVADLKIYSWPNPFSEGCTLKVNDGSQARQKINIFNLKGQRVRSLILNSGSEAQWDGKDDSGRALAAGIYFAKMLSGQNCPVHKLVLIK